MTAKSTARELVSMELRVADTMRSLRDQLSLSLADLGAACGLSAAYLSRVENHRAALTLHNLYLVAKALNVSPSSFFEEDEATLPLALCRADKGKVQKITGRKSVSLEVLAACKRGKMMEPIIVTLQPEDTRSPLRFHAGEEFNFVLEGQCAFSYGKEEILLSKGDSVYYDASVPHAMHTVGRKRCVLIAVVGSRDYLFHGDLGKLLKIDCE